MAKALKKARKPTTPKPRSFMLQTGTPRAFTDPVGYVGMQAAKTAAVEFFRSWTEWCNRHNKVGLTELYAAVKLVEETPEIDWIGEPAVVIAAKLDDHTEVTLAVRLWKKGE